MNKWIAGVAVSAMSLLMAACDEGGSTNSDGQSGSSNHVPVAVVSVPASGAIGVMINLDGSGSSDSDGDTLVYKWKLVAKPAASNTVLSATTSAPEISFTPDAAGDYQFRLIVNDGSTDSTAANSSFSVSANQAPTALGNWAATAKVLTTVTLDGSSSTDPEGQALTYKWSITAQPTGSTVSLPAETTTATTPFIPDALGDFTIQLVVNDGVEDSAPYSKTITVTNTVPVAHITGAVSGLVSGTALPLNAVAQLSGATSSDADGHTLSYAWSIVSKPDGSQLALGNAAAAAISVSLDKFGDYTLQLVVDDGFDSSAAATFQLTATQGQVALDFSVVDAEYSDQLERIVMVTADPAKIVTFDPVTLSLSSWDLPLNPTSVSVGPDGTHAAVGHNAYVSYVDLTGVAPMQTLSVSADVLDVVLAGNGYIYAFPRIDQWETIRSIKIATGAETTSTGSIYAGTKAKLHPNGTAMYGADNGLSPSDIEKYDISSGTAQILYDSPYHGDYAMCGDLWFSEDGARIFTRCANVFRASSVKAEDMLYNGSLTIGTDSASQRITSLDHSQAAGTVIAIPGDSWSDSTLDSVVKVFGYEFLTYQRTDKLAWFVTQAGVYRAEGKFVFFRSDGKQYFVIARAEPASGMLHDYAILLSPVSN